METIKDILRDMREEGHTGPSCCLEWVGAKILAYADRIEAAAKEMRDENAELKAALEPVLAVTPSAWATTNRFSLGEFQTPVYDGKWCEAAIIESQRIYKEGVNSEEL